jgi:hypothetical protein
VTTNVDIVTANVASSQLQRQSDVWASFSALANRSNLATAAALGGRRSPAVEELQFHMKVCEDRGESPGNALDVDLPASEQRGEEEEDRGKKSPAVASSVVRDAILEAEKLLEENKSLRIRYERDTIHLTVTKYSVRNVRNAGEC